MVDNQARNIPLPHAHHGYSTPIKTLNPHMGNLLVYKASAGSGKTYSLAQEYIKLALQNGSPTAYRNILAVTFTNKATCEMKERILLHLFNLAHGGIDAPFLENLLLKLNAPYTLWLETHSVGTPTDEDDPAPQVFTPELVCRRARRVLQGILHDYDHFRVETIDSFFQSLLTNLAHELNLPRSFHVDLNDDDVIFRAVDRLMKSLQEPKQKARLEGTLRTVMDYINEQVENEKGWNIERKLKLFAKSNLNNPQYALHAQELAAALANKEAIKQLRVFGRETEKAQVERIRSTAQHTLNVVNNLKGGAKRLNRANNLTGFLQKVAAGDIFPSASTYFDNALVSVEYMIKKADIHKPEVCADAEAVQLCLVELHRLREEYAQVALTASLTVQNLGPMSLLEQIERYVAEINHETNHFMLSKTPELFSQVVKKEDAAIVFERAGTTFSNIMIDEFQDTSHMQWQNFHKLLVENLASGNQCMLVGDIKQSIYRWRDGDWQILDSVIDDPDFHEKRSVTLGTNFRSRSQIVHFNNEFFPQAAAKFDTLLPTNEGLPQDWHSRISRIYRVEETQQKCHPNAEGGYVRVTVPTDGEPLFEDLMNDLYRQIVRLHDTVGVAYADMGLLVRNNRDAADIIDYFTATYPDMPLTSDVAFTLQASQGVLTLIHALRFLDNPTDRGVLAQLLRSIGPRFGWEEDMTDTLPTDFRALLEHPEQMLPEEFISPEGQKRLTRMPLYELCQHLIGLFRLTREDQRSTRVEDTDGDSAYLFRFMDAVLDFLDDNPSDISLFLEYWDSTLHKTSATGSCGDSIHVITIHKSKGLAFHTVLMPLTNWKVEDFRGDDILWCQTPQVEPFNALPVTAVSARDSRTAHSFYKTERYEEALQMHIDNINLLYVAFTRAKENLLIWSTHEPKNGNISNVGVVVTQLAQQLLTPASAGTSTTDETQEELLDLSFNVYEAGEPGGSQTVSEASAPKPSVNNTQAAPQVQNPLDSPHLMAVPIDMQTVDQTEVEFRQSNPAKDFLADASQTQELNAAQLELLQQERSYIDQGKVLHQLFQHIGSEADLPAALHALLTSGVIGSEKEAESIGRLVRKRIAAPQVKPWFNGSWELFNECDILYRDKEGKLCTRRPDRVMVKDGLTVVIDFKFGKPQDEYARQVSGYMRFMKSMGHQNVRGYIWYVFTGQVQEVEA